MFLLSSPAKKNDNTHIDKSLKSRICPLFLLKLVLSKQLMTSIADKGLKMRYSFQEQVSDLLYDRLLFLAFGQPFR